MCYVNGMLLSTSLLLLTTRPELAQVMMLSGNALANSVFEVSLHNHVKPTITSGREEKENWIRAKYERKEFIAPYPYPERNLGQQLMEAVIREDIRAVMLLLVHAQEDEVNYRYGDGDGRSALHLSCAMGNVVITQLLIWVSDLVGYKYSSISFFEIRNKNT